MKRAEFPPQFETNNAAYTFDSASGYFFEARRTRVPCRLEGAAVRTIYVRAALFAQPNSAFYYDARTKMYYKTSTQEYFTYTPDTTPPFTLFAPSQADGAGSADPAAAPASTVEGATSAAEAAALELVSSAAEAAALATVASPDALELDTIKKPVKMSLGLKVGGLAVTSGAVILIICVELSCLAGAWIEIEARRETSIAGGRRLGAVQACGGHIPAQWRR